MKKLKSFFLVFLIALTNGQSVYAANEFDSIFFNLNDITYYDAGAEDCVSGNGTVLAGNDNAEKIWNYFIGKGFSDEAAAGILGNLKQESGFNPKLTEGGREAAENETPKNGVGFGIVQWTFTDRQQPLVDLAKSQGKNTTDLDLQLDYIWWELENKYTGTLSSMKEVKSVEEAALVWHDTYEISADTPAMVQANRVEPAKTYYNQYKGTGSSSSSNSSASTSYTFIGDSITVGMQSQLESTFSGSNVKAKVGEGVTWAMSQVDSDVKDTVVINLGTNDRFTNGANLLEKLKDKQKVYLVNIYGKGTADFESTNNNISEAAKSYSNVQVLDWKGYVDNNGGRDGLYEADDFHLSSNGKELYIKFLKESLSGSSSSSNSCETSFASSKDASLTTKDGFSIFYQTDERWADIVYNTDLGYKIGTAGCGPTAMTMILVAFGVSVGPVEVAKKATELGQVVDGGASGTQAATLAKHYGLQSASVNHQSVEDINRHLDQGHLIWMGGAGIEPPFTSGGHMIVVRKKLANGNWLIANPYDYPYNKSVDNDPMKEFNPSTVVTHSNMATAVWK